MSGAGDKVPTLRFKKWKFEFGLRFWIAVALAAVVIVIGFVTNPERPQFGVLVAVSTVIGGVLGLFLQASPDPPDQSQRTTGALRSLEGLANSLRDTSFMVDEIALATADLPTRLALVSVQQDLTREINDVEKSMIDWDGVTPGSLEVLVTERKKGLEALAKLSKKEKS